VSPSIPREPEIRITVRFASELSGMKEFFYNQNWSLQKYEWDLLWVDHEPETASYKKLKPWQKVCFFPKVSNLVSPEMLLAGSLKRMKKMFPADYKIFPKTWIYPEKKEKI
jgi:hypothetical protein